MSQSPYITHKCHNVYEIWLLCVWFIYFSFHSNSLLTCSLSFCCLSGLVCYQFGHNVLKCSLVEELLQTTMDSKTATKRDGEERRTFWFSTDPTCTLEWLYRLPARWDGRGRTRNGLYLERMENWSRSIILKEKINERAGNYNEMKWSRKQTRCWCWWEWAQQGHRASSSFGVFFNRIRVKSVFKFLCSHSVLDADAIVSVTPPPSALTLHWSLAVQ